MIVLSLISTRSPQCHYKAYIVYRQEKFQEPRDDDEDPGPAGQISLAFYTASLAFF